MSVGKTCVFILAIFAWMVLYCSGIIIGTSYYRAQLDPVTGATDIYWIMYCWFMVFFNYSMSNLVMLCCLSSLIGGWAHKDPDNAVALMAKGLFVYLVVISGTLVIGSGDPTSIDQSQYVKWATMASLTSFLIGYFPDLFAGMLGKARGKVVVLDNTDPDTPPSTTVTAAEVTKKTIEVTRTPGEVIHDAPLVTPVVVPPAPVTFVARPLPHHPTPPAPPAAPAPPPPPEKPVVKNTAGK